MQRLSWKEATGEKRVHNRQMKREVLRPVGLLSFSRFRSYDAAGKLLALLRQVQIVLHNLDSIYFLQPNTAAPLKQD